MAKNTHICVVDDVCDNTHILRGKTLRHLMGEIGPSYPIVLDGVRGVLKHAPLPSEEVVFVPE